MRSRSGVTSVWSTGPSSAGGGSAGALRPASTQSQPGPLATTPAPSRQGFACRGPLAPALDWLGRVGCVNPCPRHPPGCSALVSGVFGGAPSRKGGGFSPALGPCVALGALPALFFSRRPLFGGTGRIWLLCAACAAVVGRASPLPPPRPGRPRWGLPGGAGLPALGAPAPGPCGPPSVVRVLPVRPSAALPFYRLGKGTQAAGAPAPPPLTQPVATGVRQPAENKIALEYAEFLIE